MKPRGLQTYANKKCDDNIKLANTTFQKVSQPHIISLDILSLLTICRIIFKRLDSSLKITYSFFYKSQYIMSIHFFPFYVYSI